MKKSVIILTALLLALVLCVPAYAKTAQGLLNGDFEQVSQTDNMPEFWQFHSYEAEYNGRADNASASCDTDEKYNSVLHISVKDNDDAAVFQTVAVNPSSLYKLTCLVKTKGVENGDGANISLRNVIAVSETKLYGDNDWTKLELVGRTGASQTSLTVACRIGGYSAVAHGEAWFEGFTFEKIESWEGTILPFSPTENKTDDGEGEGSAGSALPVIIVCVLALAVGAAVFFIVRSKRNKAKDGDAEPEPLPPIESYSEDRVRKLPFLCERSFFDMKGDSVPPPTDLKLRFTKRDRLYVLILTGVYALIALFRLGTLNFPTSRWEANTGDSVRIEFGRSVKLSDVWQNSGISHVKYKLVTDNGQELQFTESSGREYGHMYRWASINSSAVKSLDATTGVTLTVWGGDTSRPNSPDLVMLEMAFFDSDGNLVECTVPDSAKALFDEQSTVPETPSYYNGMYFDELYHGRTALEHIENLPVYEWTHPPLGKLIIAVGILIFGMKPFGWRIMGVLFGIAMVPILYCMAKRLLKRSELALFSTVLFTFDFMHFTQARIATVDVYGVFFIMLMTYFMLQFISMDVGDDVNKMLRPLALSGVFFGLGCASKWIGMYTGVGLAVLFFVKLVLMGVKSYKLGRIKKNVKLRLPQKFWKNCGLLCCWCVIFFIIVPVLIYAASYARYYTAQWKPARQTEIYNKAPNDYDSASDVKLGLSEAVSTYVKGVIKNQKDMYNYHSQLKSEHSASSIWWMWLADLRPAWYYIGEYQTSTNSAGKTISYCGTINGFGNPAVWTACSAATIILIFVLIIGMRKFPLAPWFIFVCLATSFLPWALVPRSTYAYHFFASVPYITLAAGYLVGWLEDRAIEKRAKNPKKAKKSSPTVWKYVWTTVAIFLFLLFFPVISGLKVRREYIGALEWVPFQRFEVVDENDKVVKTFRIGWTFTSYEPGDVNKTDKNGNKIYITRLKQ